MPKARLAQESDLEQLLDLFRVSEVSSIAQPPDRARRIWSETRMRKSMAVFVSDAGGQIVATCMLITAPNLLRSGRGHGFLENVVTQPEFRGQGQGRAVVQAALAEAWARECYHVLVQSGRKDSRIHRFYESCGFKPGVRAAYVANCPPHAETWFRAETQVTEERMVIMPSDRTAITHENPNLSG